MGELMPKKSIANDGFAAEAPLLRACRRITTYLGLDETTANLSAQLGENLSIQQAAKLLGIRYRQVILAGEWWQADGGPLLAYLEKSEEPVALLPVSPGHYRLYHSGDDTGVPIDRRVAATLLPHAFSLYLPFPSSRVGFRDILRFSFNSFWKQDLLNLVGMGILGGILGTFIPFMTGVLFEYIVPARHYSQWIWVVLLLIVSSFAAFVFQITRSIALIRMEGKLDMSLESALWDRILKLPSDFFRQFTAGDLAERAAGISKIRKTISGITVNALLAGIFSVFNLALVFSYSSPAGWTALGCAFLLVIVLAVYYNRLHKAISAQAMLGGRVKGLLYQLLRGIHKFMVTGTEHVAYTLWYQQFQELKRLDFRIRFARAWMEVFYASFPVLATLLIFTATTSMSSGLSTGHFMAMYAAFSGFLIALIALGEAFSDSLTIIPLFSRIRPILESLPEFDETKENPGILKGNITLSHVCFRYPGSNREVLSDLSLEIKAGEMVAFVGASSSGKSTVLRLLLGFEEPVSGQIFYDDRDFANLDVQEVRSQIGVVIQNSQLMSDNIYKNIIGASNLTINDAWEAARQVNLDRDIEEMPMGMHTVLNEGGSSLSGGQRQRILIARALVKKPRILFLDEATSALDNITQAVVTESLDQLKITRIVIAHRLSTIRHADKIVVFSQGQIVQKGTYEELMCTPGPFRELAQRQL